MTNIFRRNPGMMTMRRETTRKRLRAYAALAALGWWGTATVGQAVEATFRGIEGVPGAIGSTALAVSADGTTVVGMSLDASGVRLEAFRWTAAGGRESLGDLPGGRFWSRANDVSADGSVVVGEAETADGFEAFRWTASTGMVSLGRLGGAYGSARAVSADGSVIVGFGSTTSDGYSGEGFRWTADGGMVGLGTLLPGHRGSLATGITRDGTAIVGLLISNGSPIFAAPFLLTMDNGSSEARILPTGGSSFLTPSGISADRSVIAGNSLTYDGFSVLGFPYGPASRWTEAGGAVQLRSLSERTSTLDAANAVSDDGRIVVGFSFEFHHRAVRWDSSNNVQSIESLLRSYGLGDQLQGWDLQEAWDVSADGTTIVGGGTSPAGAYEAWIATIPVPEPGALSLAAIAGLGILTAARRATAKRA